MVHNNQENIGKMPPSTSPQRGRSPPEQPREVVSALDRIGLNVWVKRCGIIEGKLELLPGDSGDFVVEL